MNIITTNKFLNISDYVLMSKKYPIKILSYKKLNYIIKDNDIIFIKTDLLFEFIKNMNKINKHFILITGNSDIIIDKKYSEILDNKYLIKWFSTNSIIKHEKLINIPLGLMNEHLYFDNNPQADPKLLTEIKNKDIDDLSDILMSFKTETNYTHRQRIYDNLKNVTYITIRNFKNNDRWNKDFMLEYYKTIKSHKFVICPLGNGPDCHRYWEVLYLDRIPIIQKHPALDSFFENDKLPVLYVDDILDIKNMNLKKEYDRIKSKTYNLDIINFNYWEKIIKNR